MTDKTLKALDQIPPRSDEYGVPPEEFLVPQLRPLRAAVLDAASRYRAAETARRAAERRNVTTEFRDSQTAASLAGEDPLKVPDPRPEHTAQLERLRGAETAARTAAATRWCEFVRATVAHRDECLSLVEPVLERAQTDAIAAFESFLEARNRLDQGLGLSAWFDGLQDRGGVDGVNTRQGPRASNPNAEVVWTDHRGKAHAMPASLLRTGVGVWARGLDNLRVTRERAAAIVRRQAGDHEAQRQPVPSGRLMVHP